MPPGPNDMCRACGSALKGTRRRWIFGGQKKEPHRANVTPNGGLSRSRASSRSWGSSPSLCSPSLSSASSSSSAAAPSPPGHKMDLLAVLTHVLGRAVPRGDGRGEFLCGKCVSALERVFRFDAVIARVRALSSDKLRRLEQERDALGRWLAGVYAQRHPQDPRGHAGGSGEEDGQGEGASGAYRQLLRDNMALSEFECWSERWSSCREARGCRGGCGGRKGCEGCDSLRVTDSAYESVVGLPRRLPRPAAPLALSRDKSRSMPLDWLGPSARHGSGSSCSSSSTLGGAGQGSLGSSLRGSSQSLISGPASRSASLLSLDSLGGPDPFDWPEPESLDLTDVLSRLRRVRSSPVRTPAGSRIPVRVGPSQRGGGVAALVRELEFGEEEGRSNGTEGEERDVLTELGDEYLPLHRERSAGRQHMHNAVRQLRGQLDQAQAQIRTLQAQQRGVATLTEGVVKATVTDGPSEGSAQPVGSSDQLMVRLGQSLRCKEQVIQDCISVLRKLCVGGAVGKDSDAQALLIDKLQARLKDRELAVENAVDSQLSELRQRDQELESLRRANREKDRDLSRLNTVLHSNLDTIAELRAELSRLTQALEERGRAAEREREAWRLRDSLHRSLLKDRDALVGSLQGALSTSQKDVQALSQSVMGLGVEGSGAEGQLAGRLQEKEALLERLLREQKEKSEARWQEVEQLSAVLDDTMATIQVPSDGQAVSSVWAQLGEARRQLRERESEGREREREWRSEREEREREERVLRESLEKRDKLIQQVLSDSEERERLLSDLQHSLLTLQEPRTALKHTL